MIFTTTLSYLNTGPKPYYESAKLTIFVDVSIFYHTVTEMDQDRTTLIQQRCHQSSNKQITCKTSHYQSVTCYLTPRKKVRLPKCYRFPLYQVSRWKSYMPSNCISLLSCETQHISVQFCAVQTTVSTSVSFYRVIYQQTVDKHSYALIPIITSLFHIQTLTTIISHIYKHYYSCQSFHIQTRMSIIQPRVSPHLHVIFRPVTCRTVSQP